MSVAAERLPPPRVVIPAPVRRNMSDGDVSNYTIRCYMKQAGRILYQEFIDISGIIDTIEACSWLLDDKLEKQPAALLQDPGVTFSISGGPVVTTAPLPTCKRPIALNPLARGAPPQMLTIFGKSPRGKSSRFCDGHNRREFLQIGGLTFGGLMLPQLLRAENSAGVRKSHKSIIMIFLPGGPPHQDMWDIKSDAPSEIRGEFSAIPTSVPGIEVGELFPKIAASMEKFVPIRSIVGADGDHFAYQCLTGWRKRDRQPQGGWPALGAVLSKVYGPVDPSVPPFVGLSPRMGHMPWADNGVPGFLGVAHAPFTPNAEGKDDLVLNGITLDRLGDRRAVLASLDRFRREADSNGQMIGTDAFTEQAFGVLTSSKLAEALDIEKEDQKLRDHYGRGVNKLRDDGGPRLVDNFLIARRLVSAGARCVTLAFSRWDWHGGNFQQGREDMPLLDQGVAALVEDLEQRGMLDDTTVIVWGEFGRTPKINKDAGRDHWPQVSCALLAGGGMKTGQVIGATNRLGEYATDRPVHFQEVFATLYKNLGINVDHLTLRDLQGRPQFLIDQNKYRALPELG